MAMPLRLRLRTALRALTGRSTTVENTTAENRRNCVITESAMLGMHLTEEQIDHLVTLPPSLRINLLSTMAHQQQVTQIATHTETIAHTLDAALRTPDSTLIRALRNT